MPGRWLLAIGLAPLLLGACRSISPSSAADHDWADTATGAIATVNDVVALEVVTALVPAAVGQSAYPVSGDPDPDWPNLASACKDLTAVLPQVAAVEATAASRFTSSVASHLRRYCEDLADFAQQCIAAAATQDLQALKGARGLLFSASDELADATKLLPSDTHCPDNMPKRPKTCDVGS